MKNTILTILLCCGVFAAQWVSARTVPELESSGLNDTSQENTDENEINEEKPDALLSREPGTLLTETDDDFWLLLEYEPPQNVIWLFGGVDNSSGRYYGLTTELAISEALRFNLSATQQKYSVESMEQNWGFSGHFNETFGWGLLNTFWGKKDKLQRKDNRLTLMYFNGGFNGQLSYETGDVELFFNELAFLQTSSASIDHSAIELGLGYSWPEIYLQFIHKNHHYEKDLSALQSSQFLQLIIDPIGIQQASGLAALESSVLLGIQKKKYNYEANFSRIKSAVSRETGSYATLRLLKAINKQLQLGFEIELPIDDVPFSAGLSLGYMW